MDQTPRTYRSVSAAAQALVGLCVLGASGLGSSEASAQLRPDTANATTIRLETSSSVDLAPFFAQEDGQRLRYTAEPLDSALVAVTISGSTIAVSTPVVGTVYVQVEVTDGQGRAVARMFRIIVARRNDPMRRRP